MSPDVQAEPDVAGDRARLPPRPVGSFVLLLVAFSDDPTDDTSHFVKVAARLRDGAAACQKLSTAERRFSLTGALF